MTRARQGRRHGAPRCPRCPRAVPYTLTATSAAASARRPAIVLIGDVWLCSGQSNMEYAGRAVAQRPQARSRNANDPQTADADRSSATPARPRTATFTTPGRVAAGHPADHRRFLRRLLVHGARSARVAEGAVRPDRRDLGRHRDQRVAQRSIADRAIRRWREQLALARLIPHRSRQGAPRCWGETWTEWWRGKGDAGSEPWQPDAPGEWKPVPVASIYWEQWGVAELASYNGMLWYRTEMTLDRRAGEARRATLALGVVDDHGRELRQRRARWARPLAGTVVAHLSRSPPARLKAGVNRIAVGALDTWGPGGMHGTRRPARAHASPTAAAVAAARTRRSGASAVTPGIGDPPHAPWESASPASAASTTR